MVGQLPPVLVMLHTTAAMVLLIRGLAVVVVEVALVMMPMERMRLAEVALLRLLGVATAAMAAAVF